MDRLDRYFGVHGQALALRSERMQVLASNIANAATPGFKARDLDFAGVLADEQQTSAASLRRTASGHLSAENQTDTPQLRYRQPLQPSLDGNTVELATEQVQFAETAIRYRSSLSFLNSRIGNLMSAMKGE